MPNFSTFDDYPDFQLETERPWQPVTRSSYRGLRETPVHREALADRVISVSVAVGQLRDAVGKTLGGLWISGEVSNLSKPVSGHVYFTIKDRDAQIRCAYFAGQARLNPATFRTGDRIEVCGHPDVYAKSGDLQIKVTQWRHAGAGALYEAYLRLKHQLSTEGLFDLSVKKPLPRFVKRVVVVTSAQAAAFQDVIRTVRRRMPWVELTLSPAFVQGAMAPRSLIEALKRADRAQPDVILLVRGGGSFEDLMAFNDEKLVRTLRTLNVPVIAGIGHESDETLASLAADVCASTPTAAAEQLGPEIGDWLRQLNACADRLERAVVRSIDDATQTLDRFGQYLQRQEQGFERKAEQLVRAETQLTYLIEQNVKSREVRLNRSAWHLSQLGDVPVRREETLLKHWTRFEGSVDAYWANIDRRCGLAESRLKSPDLLLKAHTGHLARAEGALQTVFSQQLTQLDRRLNKVDGALDVVATQTVKQQAYKLERLAQQFPLFEKTVDEATVRLRALGHALLALDPEKPLRQGYAWVERGAQPVSSVFEIQQGQHLTLRFADGLVEAEALDVKKNECF
ncbi:MAG: exodeoxyribonuclease VII large subunit [Sutterella wadsworthensis]|nr:exodeoxyribonuclease VII large subunit [Sutterella wadsworthensis]